VAGPARRPLLGVAVMDFLDIEKRFSNLQSLWGGSALQVMVFEDQSRAIAFEKLISLQKQLKNETDLFDPFLQWLSHLHWDLRGYVGSTENAIQHWTTRSSELTSHFLSLRHALSEVRIKAVEELTSSLQSLSLQDLNYGNFLLEVIDPDNSVVIVERQWQRRFVQEFFSESPGFEDMRVTHIAAFLRGERNNFAKTYLLAPPRRIQENYMRALILGGAINSATFLSSNWIAGKEPQKLRQDLVPGLAAVRKPAFSVLGNVFSTDVYGISDEEIESFSFSPAHGDFQEFSNNGITKCRLIEIANDYVMPIEIGASRVSVLSSSADGGLEVQYRVPGDTLEVGDVLFDLRDGAEEDFLMEAAQSQMGPLFADFAKGRSEWKLRARHLIEEVGLNSAIKRLKSSGVGTAENLMLWLENQDFTTPRATKDWKNLLEALSFSESEVANLIHLGSELRKTLIEVGRNARLHMSDAVSQEEMERILAHQVVTKQLDEFGDAVFVLGMVTAFGSAEKNCEPHEIRRVLRR